MRWSTGEKFSFSVDDFGHGLVSALQINNGNGTLRFSVIMD